MKIESPIFEVEDSALFLRLEIPYKFHGYGELRFELRENIENNLKMKPKLYIVLRPSLLRLNKTENQKKKKVKLREYGYNLNDIILNFHEDVNRIQEVLATAPNGNVQR